MLKLKQTLPLFAAAIFLTAFSATANAQNPVLTAEDNGPCRDKWINYAYRTELRRKPVGSGDRGECLIGLYKAGNWRNYAELKDAVRSWDTTRRARSLIVKLVNAKYVLARSGREVIAYVRKVINGQVTINDFMNTVLATFREGSRSLFDASTEKISVSTGSTLLIQN